MKHATFDRFEFDVGRRALLDGGNPVHLSPKAFRLLEVLIGNSPRALSKEELTEAVWPQTIVEESNLASLVAELPHSPRRRRPASAIRPDRSWFWLRLLRRLTRAEPRQRAAVLQIGGEEYPIFEGRTILGRDPSAAIPIDHATVSRRHASLTIDQSSAVLEDLGSKNGTFLNGEKERLTAPAQLEEGTTFVLGDVRIVFRRGTALGSTLTIGG